MIDLCSTGGEILDDTGQLLGVRPGRPRPLLSPGHPGGGDQLHGSGDLLGVLDAADAAAQDSFGSTWHGLRPRPG